MCSCSVCALPVFSLPAFFFFFSSSQANIESCVWFSPNSSVIGINLKRKIEGYPQMKRGRKWKIQPDTMQWCMVSGSFVCVWHTGSFYCFQASIKILCVWGWFLQKSGTALLINGPCEKPSSDRAQALQTKCPSVKLVFCFWRTKSNTCILFSQISVWVRTCVH